VWAADDLLVSFGARGSGFTTTSGQATLDNLIVRTGTVVPEPGLTAFTVLALAAVPLARRRRHAL
jgi:MYXO-CTERM domain-containing protein